MRVLTGINTTGTLHFGNYCGAIRPCVQASKRDDVESFFFMADLHALIMPAASTPNASRSTVKAISPKFRCSIGC